MSNAIKNSATSWFDLPKDAVDLILSKMTFISLLNFGAVCRSWHTVLKSFVSSSSYSQGHQVPWLMLPEAVAEDVEDHKTIRFFTFEDKKVLKHLNTPPEFYDGLCLGTSHSWLVMLDEHIEPCLFSPFSLRRIALPKLDTYPSIISVSVSTDFGYVIRYSDRHYELSRRFVSVHGLRAQFISKAVVSANPSNSNGIFFVVMIFELGTSGAAHLAFCWCGDSKWIQLGNDNDSYRDVICHEDKFLASNHLGSIEIWDVHDSYPVKSKSIPFEFPLSFSVPSFIDDYTTRSYLVEACGYLFLVQRYIGEYMDESGPFGLQQKYMTLLFQVYKLDSNDRWEEVELLGNQVFFLGGNQSKSLSVHGESAFKANSIYFSDDSWDLFVKQNDYFDLGVFNMEDKSIKPYHLSNLLIEPPPFWIDPEPLLDRRNRADPRRLASFRCGNDGSKSAASEISVNCPKPRYSPYLKTFLDCLVFVCLCGSLCTGI